MTCVLSRNERGRVVVVVVAVVVVVVNSSEYSWCSLRDHALAETSQSSHPRFIVRVTWNGISIATTLALKAILFRLQHKGVRIRKGW